MTMLPLFITFLLGAVVCLLLLSLSRFVGPRRPTPVKVLRGLAARAWTAGCAHRASRGGDRRARRAGADRGRPRRWGLHQGVGLAVLVALAWAGTPDSEAQPPIRIGASLSQTGVYATLGQNQLRGYQLCLKHVNDTGGLLGRKLRTARTAVLGRLRIQRVATGTTIRKPIKNNSTCA